MDHSHHSHHSHWQQIIETFQPTDILGFIMILFASLSLSLHCAAMCGPLACAVLGQRASLREPGIWLYNLGRLISYIAAGAFLGYLTQSASQAFAPLGALISILLGTILIVIGLWRLLPLPLKTWPTPKFASHLTRKASRLPSGWRDFGFGLVTVLLPCMTLTPALAVAAASQSAQYAAIFMAAFALGTIPIMLAATNVPLVIYRRVPPQLTRALLGFFLLVAGIITVFRVFH